MTEILITNELDRQRAYREIDDSKEGTLIIFRNENSYTKKQRGALHIWCQQCADTLNNAGITFKRKSVFGDHDLEMPWTMFLFKDQVYKLVLAAMTGKDSTEKQNTVNPSHVALVISRQYAENGLICPPWPSLR